MKQCLAITNIRGPSGERHPAVIVETEEGEHGERREVARMRECTEGADREAALLAAAPELLRACVEAREELLCACTKDTPSPDQCDCWACNLANDLDAAIANARGGAR